eukprot:CAMPEP_0182885378 /NCGR_PEP_ID=MMETSP0034_2-20130328/19576_1 /TAXON_ID=156128 /ORGANISM="Nephroselmis pyriformis, Strain CCMP717" /LENGTH=42 /DNA_ID= /DNA_START= /DNA_END= /DNA_ORIENTATION=
MSTDGCCSSLLPPTAPPGVEVSTCRIETFDWSTPATLARAQV